MLPFSTVAFCFERRCTDQSPGTLQHFLASQRLLASRRSSRGSSGAPLPRVLRPCPSIGCDGGVRARPLSCLNDISWGTPSQTWLDCHYSSSKSDVLQVYSWNLPAALRRVATLVERTRSGHTTRWPISISNRLARRRSRAWTRRTKLGSR